MLTDPPHHRLIKHGADVWRSDRRGMRPVDWAASKVRRRTKPLLPLRTNDLICRAICTAFRFSANKAELTNSTSKRRNQAGKQVRVHALSLPIESRSLNLTCSTAPGCRVRRDRGGSSASRTRYASYAVLRTHETYSLAVGADPCIGDFTFRDTPLHYASQRASSFFARWYHTKSSPAAIGLANHNTQCACLESFQTGVMTRSTVSSPTAPKLMVKIVLRLPSCVDEYSLMGCVATNKDGFTSLHSAIQNVNYGMVKKLLECNV